MNSSLRIVLIVCGTMALALAIIGIVVPILPTTPFLLLSAACYARGSQRFYHWLMSHKHLGGYIRNYREGRGATLRTKLATLAMLWLTIGLSACFAVDSLVVRVLLLLVAVGVTIHLVTIPTMGR